MAGRKLKHSDVALAFLEGRMAENHRLSTDGRAILDRNTCLAAKAPNGTIVLLLVTKNKRSGAIARSAIAREVMRSGKRYDYCAPPAEKHTYGTTVDDLLGYYAESCKLMADLAARTHNTERA